MTRFFRPLQKEEWKVLVDARRARVIGFLNPIEETAASSVALSALEARRRALDAAAKLGYPADSYSVLEVGTRDRPKRRDTTVVLESRPAGVGEARPRLTAVFHGSRLAAFYPSIRVPESFVRQYRRQTFLQPILMGGKVVAIGSFFGIAIVLFIRLSRGGGVAWNRLWPGLAVAGALAAAALVNGSDTLLRGYETDDPLSLFLGARTTVLLLGWLLILCAAAVCFVLISGARPGWRRALRAQGKLSDAFLRAAIAAAGLVGLERAVSILSERMPDLFEVDPSLPSALEHAVPAMAVLWTASVWTLLLGTAAAVVAIAAREPLFRRGVILALALAAILLALIPISFHSPVESLWQVVAGLLMLGWLAVAAYVLLREHVAAWVFFGALASGGSAAAKLLAQPAAADQAAGAAAVLLLLLAAAALVVGRRREPPAPEPLAVDRSTEGAPLEL